MLVLARGDARATLVVADSPKMMLTWRVPMASRRLPLSWMALIALTSLGDLHSNGAPRVVLGVVVALVLKGRRVVRGGPVLGSGVVGCLTIACWRFYVMDCGCVL